MQKHLLKLFLASICIFTLTGCNQKNDEIKNSAANKEQVEDAKEKVIEELQENAVKNEKKISSTVQTKLGEETKEKIKEKNRNKDLNIEKKEEIKQEKINTEKEIKNEINNEEKPNNIEDVVDDKKEEEPIKDTDENSYYMISLFNEEFPLNYGSHQIISKAGLLSDEDLYRNFIASPNAYNASTITPGESEDGPDYITWDLLADNVDCTETVYKVKIKVSTLDGLAHDLIIYNEAEKYEIKLRY